jgi:glycosyltransferase involved in cell wall biosynthesis
VAWYNLELLPGLALRHQIDIFVDGHPGQFTRPDAEVSVYDAHDFVWKHFRQPYDLVVYQLGNSPCHDYMWAYLVRYPGLVVLHDGQLHHARARHLLQQRREDDYRREFAFNHPHVSPDVAELGIIGCLGPSVQFWPMLRIVVEASRLVIVHNEWLADRIRDDHPLARAAVVEMGVPAPRTDADARTVRARHGIAPDAIVFTAFGKVTPEKCLSAALAGIAAIVDAVPQVHVLLVGETVEHYDPEGEARVLGIQDRVSITGYVRNNEIPDYMAATDVCLCMRWPSSRETSASWLRCLAAGRPSIITDLVHMTDIPTFDPRTWALLHAPTVPPSDVGSAAVAPAAVSIDVMDLNHSLRVAMRRLAADARLRDVLGRSARQLWQERFTVERMVSGYLAAIEVALASPSPPVDLLRKELPGHLLPDGTELATALMVEMGLPESTADRVWAS